MTDTASAPNGRTALEGLRRRLDAALTPLERGTSAEVVLLAHGSDVFVAQELAAALSEAGRDDVSELGDEDLLEEYLPDRRWELSCWNPGSMLSTSWGFGSFVLGSRGYVYEESDTDMVVEAPYRLLGAWEPADSRAAYEAAWVEIYVAWWETLGLPPAAGALEDGPPELVLRAVQRISASDPWVRESEPFEDLVDWLEEETNRSREEIEALLGVTRPNGEVRPLPPGEESACGVPMAPAVLAMQTYTPPPVRAEELLWLIGDATIGFRKTYGMFGQINISVVGVTPEELTVTAWTCRLGDPRGLARSIRRSFLLCKVDRRTYLADCVPCEWLRCLIVDPDDRKRILFEARFRFRALARRLGLTHGEVLPIDTGLRPLPQSLRLRLAWRRLLEASRSGGPPR